MVAIRPCTVKQTLNARTSTFAPSAEHPLSGCCPSSDLGPVHLCACPRPVRCSLRAHRPAPLADGRPSVRDHPVLLGGRVAGGAVRLGRGDSPKALATRDPALRDVDLSPPRYRVHRASRDGAALACLRPRSALGQSPQRSMVNGPRDGRHPRLVHRSQHPVGGVLTLKSRNYGELITAGFVWWQSDLAP